MPTTPAREMRVVGNDEEFLNTICTPPMPQVAAAAAAEETENTTPVIDRSGTVQGIQESDINAEMAYEGSEGNSPYRTPGRPTDPPRSVDNSQRWSVSEWASQVSEDIGFSLISRSFILFLLVSSLLFTTLLTLRLMISVSTRVFLPGSPEMFGTISMLLSLVLISSFAATVIDLIVRLIVSWTSMTKDTVHVFYLPNKNYSPRKSIRMRNAYLGLLLIFAFVGPLIASIASSIIEGSLLVFIGTFSFYSFVSFNCVIAVVWLFMWGVSIQNKFRYWKIGKHMRREWKESNKGKSRREIDDVGDEYDNERTSPTTNVGVAWFRRVAANPIVMSEFGLDLLTVRLYSAFSFSLTIWIFLMVVIYNMTIDKLHWVFILTAVLIGSFFLLLSKAKPSSRSSKTAKNQYVVSHVMLFCWAAFIIFGVIASALRFGTGTAVANMMLCVLTQGLLVRRHSLHITNDFIIPYNDDIDNPTKCIPAVVPCSSVFGFFFPKNSCAPIQKPSRILDRELGLYTSDQHCIATEKHLNKTHRVLTANSVVSSGIWISFVVLSAVLSSYGSWFHEEHTTNISGSPSIQQATGLKYAVCDMTLEGIDISEIAVMTLLAKHKNDDKLHEDVSVVFEGKYTATRLTFAADQLSGVSFTDNTTTVVIANRGSEAREWSADFDVFGDSILLNGFSSMSPLSPAWSSSVQKQVVSFLRKLSGCFGSTRAFKIDQFRGFAASEVSAGRKVVLSGHAVAGAFLVSELAESHPVVAFGSPGTSLTFDMSDAAHVNIQPVGSALSFFDHDVGFLQEIECQDSSMSTCQTISTITCELLRNCGSSLVGKMSLC